MAIITGTLRGNLLEGTSLTDIIRGLAGRDTLRGGLGNDSLAGGEGADHLYGGAGDDLLNGYARGSTAIQSGDIGLLRVGPAFDQPVFVTSAPGDPDRLFVVEKTGHIRILNLDTGASRSFLDIPAGQLSTGGEQGLLGLAFHPDYASNGKFYVYMVTEDGDLELRQYRRATANSANPDSGNVILTIAHPDNSNHNGGWLGFGPDGMLYIATGDGGAGGDPTNNAQNTNVLLGKILRIDVNGDDFAGNTARDYAIPDDNPFADSAGADEIWAYGLRNPWRPSFDRATGDLYIADVGQNAEEESQVSRGGRPAAEGDRRAP